MFNRLWDSTLALFNRFSILPDNPDLEAQARVCNEEMFEFLQAVERQDMYNLLTLTGKRVEILEKGFRDSVFEEAADVVVTVFGMLQLHGYMLVEFEEYIQTVIDKNNAKTLDTHYVNAKGKITKRENN